jgi:hypothetical protein
MSGAPDGGNLMQIKTLGKVMALIACAITVWGCGVDDRVPRLNGALSVVETPAGHAYLKVVREPATGACWLIAYSGYDAIAMTPSPCPPTEAK